MKIGHQVFVIYNCSAFDGGDLTGEKMLKINSVRSPNNGCWFVILMEGKLWCRLMKANEREDQIYEHEEQKINSSNCFSGRVGGGPKKDTREREGNDPGSRQACRGATPVADGPHRQEI